MSADWRCTHGSTLLDRCPQPRAIITDYGHPELCFWHGKLAAGVLQREPMRLTRTPDAVVSDEVLELGWLLRREGA